MNCFLQRSFPVSGTKQFKNRQRRSFAKALGLLICAFFVQAGLHAQQQHTYHNADSANPILNATPKPKYGIKQMRFVDIDGDGDLDCYMMLEYNTFVLYRNVGTVNRPEYQLSDSTGFEDAGIVFTNDQQHFAFFDYDGDGDQDAFLEGYRYTSGPCCPSTGFIQSYLNDGTRQKPHFVYSGYAQAYLSYAFTGNYSYFTLQDFDGDGDVDFNFLTKPNSRFEGGFNGYLQNQGTLSQPHYSNILYTRTVFPNPQNFIDFTGDGLPDCIEYSLGSNLYFPNTGTKAAPYIDVTKYPNGVTPPKAFDFGDIGVASLVDLNNDGKLEVFNDTGAYATAVPVPVIRASTKYNNAGTLVTTLTASPQKPGYIYRWEYNGQIVKGNTKPTINATKAGKYVLYIKDNTGIGVSLPYITPAQAGAATTKLTVSAGPVVQGLTAQVYPNPFAQSITLSFRGGSASATKTIRVSDVLGKVWLAQTTSSASVQVGAALPKGMYQLQVWQNNTLVYHTKILKQ